MAIHVPALRGHVQSFNSKRNLFYYCRFWYNHKLHSQTKKWLKLMFKYYHLKVSCRIHIFWLIPFFLLLAVRLGVMLDTWSSTVSVGLPFQHVAHFKFLIQNNEIKTQFIGMIQSQINTNPNATIFTSVISLIHFGKEVLSGS